MSRHAVPAVKGRITLGFLPGASVRSMRILEGFPAAAWQSGGTLPDSGFFVSPGQGGISVSLANYGSHGPV